MRLNELLSAACLTNPDKPFVVSHRRSCTAVDIENASALIMSRIEAHGIKSGHRVVIIARSSVNLVAAMFAILDLGAVFVPLNPGHSPGYVSTVLNDCEPTAVIVDAQAATRHEVALSDFVGSTFVIGGDTEPVLLEERRMECRQDLKLCEPGTAYIAYTSGSAGIPRGVVCGHEQACFAVSAINKVIGNCSSDVILCGLPLSFDYGLYQIFLALDARATVVLAQDLMSAAIPRLVHEHGITALPLVPSAISLLIRSRVLERVHLPTVRYVTSTGDTLTESRRQRLAELLPSASIIPMYGLTECKRVSIMPPSFVGQRPGSVGLPLPGTSVSLTSRPVGELLVSGPHLMSGYWNDAEATARRYFINSQGVRSLRTGDLFRMDSAGFLYFVGRQEGFIKSRQHRVNPREIELEIETHPKVAEVIAVGTPDPELGEAIAAFVIPSSSSDLTADELLVWCRSTLPPFMRPREIRLCSEFPRTANGKIDRAMLKDEAMKAAET